MVFSGSSSCVHFSIISAHSSIMNTDRCYFPRLLVDTFVMMILSLLGFASGCLMLFLQPYDFLFKMKTTFSEGGEIFEMWRKPEVDLYLKVYLFNVTNRDEYLDGREAKLRFQQVGPYVYK